MTTKAETKTWKETIGEFLTKKGLAIGTGLVVLGGVLQGTTDWVNGVIGIIKAIFGV